LGSPSRRSYVLCATAVLAGVLASPSTVRAGGWHQGDSLICSDCHTMHNSDAGAPMRYDGVTSSAPALLRSADAQSLCVSCHDGSRFGAPDVVGERAADYELVDPAAGAFAASIGAPSDAGHDLGHPTPLVPPDGDTPVMLTCATCHEPHGSPQYRNLRPSPSGTGRASAVQVLVDEAVKPDGRNAAQVYATSNLRYRSGMSAWCLDCHNRYDPSVSHPAERSLYGSWMVDYDHWFNGPFENRVRVQNPTDVTATVPSADDQVFCLSCHKAHGSPNLPGLVPTPNALIHADGQTIDSTCAQCHDK
jgi:nitrate/TMAO reductase-like tetraheme cytochrome c subunit